MRNTGLMIIPAYNEEMNIGKVLEGVLELKLPLDILVVNDGSSDQTGRVAGKYSVQVANHPINLGYGAALQTGYQYASASGYEYVIQFDGDGQHNAADLPRMLEAARSGLGDIVIGSRYLEENGFKAGLSKKAAVLFFRSLIRLLTGVNVSDPTSGFRALRSNVFSYYAERGRFPADFPDADMLIHQILRQYKVAEIPVRMKEREAGVSMHAGLKPVFYMFKMLLSILIVLLSSRGTKEAGKT